MPSDARFEEAGIELASTTYEITRIPPLRLDRGEPFDQEALTSSERPRNL
jgi:hypothetical protein